PQRNESQTRERDFSIHRWPGKRCDELCPRVTKGRIFRSGNSLSERSARVRSSPDHGHGRAHRIANPRAGGRDSKAAAIIRASLTPPNNAKGGKGQGRGCELGPELGPAQRLPVPLQAALVRRY